MCFLTKSLKRADLKILETKFSSLFKNLPKGFSMFFSSLAKNMKTAARVSELATQRDWGVHHLLWG